MSLEDLRAEIDSIDGEIVRLLGRRAEVVLNVAKEKRGRGLPVRDPRREAEVLARIVSKADGSLSAQSLTNVFRTIMAEAVALQRSRAGGGSVCSRKPGGKLDVPVQIVENHGIAGGFHRMRFAFPGADRLFSPGQFFQLALRPGSAEPFLRRPFAPSEVDPAGFAFVYAAIGRGTEYMTTLSAGEEVGLLAPLGRGYTLAEPGSRAVVVGGGCGAPSLGPLAAGLRDNRVEVVSILGARSADRLVGGDCLEPHSRRIVSCTDDGSAGMAGTAADALFAELARDRADAVYACGPVPMLKAVAAIAGERGIFCEVSLEERMACGFGACVGCAVETSRRGGGDTKYSRVCHDGPVFDARDIVWR